MFALLWAALAAASTPGVLTIPYTPDGERQEYAVGVPVKGGAQGARWASSAPGFHCEPAGDRLMVRIAVDEWPSVLPKRVTCEEVGGTRKARVRIRIQARTHQSQFVSDGTLVMPRERRASARYRGPIPGNPDLVVGTGQSESLGVTCRVERGPELVVIAGVEQRDGVGRCSVRTREGGVHWIPIRVVTVK